ncbi:MAG: hypothetical protein AB7E95_09645, partial [Kiritimatiellales bacterium]
MKLNRSLFPIVIIIAGIALPGYGEISTELIIDGGFEYVAGTDPSETSFPWGVEGEDGDWSVTTSGHEATDLSENVFHSGSQSVFFNWNGDSAYLYQTIFGAAFDSSKTYEASFWMYSYDDGKGKTGATKIKMNLFVRKDSGSDWVYVNGFTGEVANTQPGRWEQFAGAIQGE